jgi:hypothetical protein
MVSRTRLRVTLYVHCLSCCISSFVKKTYFLQQRVPTSQQYTKQRRLRFEITCTLQEEVQSIFHSCNGHSNTIVPRTWLGKVIEEWRYCRGVTCGNKRKRRSAYHSEQVYPEVKYPVFTNLLGTFLGGARNNGYSMSV